MKQRYRRRRPGNVVLLMLAGLVPLLMGGCPEFRNGAVDAVDAAATSVILSDVPTDEATNSAVRGVLDAALTLFFDQFRTENFR